MGKNYEMGCCLACNGLGSTLSGPCSDCFATGHCHPESEPCYPEGDR